MALTSCRPSPSCSRSLASCFRCPVRRFPLRVGWSRWELCRKILAFPATSSAGDHTVSCGLPPFPPRLGFKQFGLHHTRPSFLTSGPWYSGFISLAHIMLLSPHAFRVKVSLCSLKAQVRCCFNHITPVMPLPGQRLLCHMGAILWALRSPEARAW